MEPILPERFQRDRDVQVVFNRLAGYRVFLRSAPNELERKTEVCVYVLPGASGYRGNVVAAFESLHARIVDTENAQDRDAFLNEIVSIGDATHAQVRLPRSGVN